MSRRNARWLDFLSQFSFDIAHVRGVANVADHLSRVPGSEVLEGAELCSMFCTLGVEHVFVEPEKKAIACVDVGCNAVISVYDQPTLLQSILKS